MKKNPKSAATARLRELADNDPEAFEAHYQELLADDPSTILVPRLRARVLDRLHGPDAAVDFLMEAARRGALEPSHALGTMPLFIRAGRHREGLDLLDRFDGITAERGELVFSRLQLALHDRDHARLRRMLDAIDLDPIDDPRIPALRAAAHCVFGREPEAIALMVDAIQRAARPDVLAPALPFFSPEARAYLGSVFIEAAGPSSTQSPTVAMRIARALRSAEDHANARAVAESLAHDEKLGDEALLVAAGCAHAMGDREAALAHLSTVVLRQAAPRIRTPLADAVRSIVYDGVDVRRLDDVVAVLPQLGDLSRRTRDEVDLVDGRARDIIDRFDVAEWTAEPRYGALRHFVAACVETGSLDQLYDVLSRLPDPLPLKVHELARLSIIVPTHATGAARSKIQRSLVERLEPTDPHRFSLRLELATDDEIEEVVRDCVEFLAEGRPALVLRLALALNAARVLPHIADPALAARLMRTNSAFETFDELSHLPALAAERHLCAVVHRSQPRPRDALVSVIIPVHRAEDLPNVRANLLRQTWPNLEAVVIANGELYQSNSIMPELADVPRLTLIHADGENVGAYLNKGIAASSGDFVVRFDGDDIYLDDYITTSITHMEATRADAAGRASCFVYIEALNRLFLRTPKPYYGDTRAAGYYGCGATHIFRREVFDRVQYLENVERGEDYLFFEQVGRLGFVNVNLDPFNFVIVRKADKTRHTWLCSDLDVLPDDFRYVGGLEALPRLGMPTAPKRPVLIGRHARGLALAS